MLSDLAVVYRVQHSVVGCHGLVEKNIFVFLFYYWHARKQKKSRRLLEKKKKRLPSLKEKVLLRFRFVSPSGK